MMAAMFALFMIEMALHTSGNGHSHGGAIGEGLHTNDAPVNNFYNHKRNESYSSEDTYWLDERNRGWAEYVNCLYNFVCYLSISNVLLENQRTHFWILLFLI